MKDLDHLLRVAATFVVVTVGFLVVRGFLIPPTFGKLGHYRAAAVDDVKAMPVRYAGRAARDACARCHAGPVRDRASSSHRGVWCETCHGAAGAHAADPKSVKPGRPAKGEMRAFCGRCHASNITRPRGFPQVNLSVHNPGAACTECHDSHKPKL
ncbi:MAG: multiheme c-type cytochrome [Candidatus Coatesbacteria bacterium]